MSTHPVADAAKLANDLGDPGLVPLFSQAFVSLSARYEELVDSACREALSRSGAWPPAEGEAPAAAAERLGVPPAALPAFSFLSRKLVDSGHLRLLEGGDGRLAPAGDGPPPFPETLARFVADEPAAAVGAELVALLVEEAPEIFGGRKSGEDVLFSPQRLPLWFRYFSNDNPLYSVNNALGALVLRRELARRAGTGTVVLEVGGGAGSAAAAFLRSIAADAEGAEGAEGTVARYRFTEFVPTFLRRGERAARAAAPPSTAVEAFRLDMTKPWAAQGVEPGSCDAVYAVNCFHVAPDLDAVLAEAHAALAPGGVLVLSECVKPGDPARPIYVDFVFEFLGSFTGAQTHPARRPVHGFLSPPAWRASLEHAGFTGTRLVPDVERLSAVYPDFFVAAVTATRP